MRYDVRAHGLTEEFVQQHTSSDSGPLLLLKPPIIIRKGPRGYGFTLKAIRVYSRKDSNYYTLQHIVVVSCQFLVCN